jgi:translation initiation factor 3 subunit E
LRLCRTFALQQFSQQIYDETELLKAKLDILSKTNMIDYAIDIRKQLYPNDEVPEDLKQRRVHVVAQLQELQQEVQPILKIMADDEVMKNMENMRDSKTLINFLSKDYKVIVCALAEVIFYVVLF